MARRRKIPQIVNPVSRYMMASYGYYVLNRSLITDGEFDQLGVYLLENKEKYKDHPHIKLLDDDTLKAGTYLGEYPNIVKNATVRYIKEYRVWV